MFEKKHQNSGTLYKDTINNWIILFLRLGKFSFNNGEQPDVYFLDVTCIGILLLGFISKSLKKSLNRFINILLISTSVFFCIIYIITFIIFILKINFPCISIYIKFSIYMSFCTRFFFVLFIQIFLDFHCFF